MDDFYKTVLKKKIDMEVVDINAIGNYWLRLEPCQYLHSRLCLEIKLPLSYKSICLSAYLCFFTVLFFSSSAKLEDNGNRTEFNVMSDFYSLSLAPLKLKLIID